MVPPKDAATANPINDPPSFFIIHTIGHATNGETAKETLTWPAAEPDRTNRPFQSTDRPIQNGDALR